MTGDTQGNYKTKSPVLFLVFNRPDVTKRVFEAIRQAKPPRLYVAADGPRSNRAGESEKCVLVRNIATNVDWNCEIKTLFRNDNLGCRYAVSGAITWFFEKEPEGIVLEDDCLPSDSFFQFCDDLLHRYRNDTRIMMISGHNGQTTWNAQDSDFFFSNIGSVWGWAAWRRAWQEYDVDLKRDDINYGGNLNRLEHLLGKEICETRKKHYAQVIQGLDTWDYQWSFTRHFNSGLSCVASKNLVTNIGFSEEATHTKKYKREIERNEIEFPLRQNPIVIADLDFDRLIHGKKRFSARIWKKLRSIVCVSNCPVCPF